MGKWDVGTKGLLVKHDRSQYSDEYVGIPREEFWDGRNECVIAKNNPEGPEIRMINSGATWFIYPDMFKVGGPW